LSDEATQSRKSTVAMGAGAQALQKVGVLGAKAALSTIPWAALVFDLGQAAIDYGNARLTDRLLGDLGERIDRMEAGARERLKADEIYQLSAQAAIRRMLTETNPSMADALARAVVELGKSDDPPSMRLEIARALDTLTEPSLHLLQTIYRMEQSLLSQPELDAAGGPPTKTVYFNTLITESMELLSWVEPTAALQRAGLIDDPPQGGMFAEAMEAPRYDTAPFKVLLLGKTVVRLCFGRPGAPAFGRFAEPPEGSA
jgi:hypothetical protein